MDIRRCIVGLGNPGSRYAATRHNIGFRVIAALSTLLRVPMNRGHGEYLEGSWVNGTDELLLIAPTTYMNDSGFAVREVAGRYEIPPEQLLVVLDDFQLPLGMLRFRRGGSDGGHNGLASVIYQLQTDQFPRARVGIAGKNCPSENRRESMADYVLSPFEADEIPVAAHMIETCRDGCLVWVHHGIARAMNEYNKTFVGAPVNEQGDAARHA